ncbi:2Fe-2S iron-sulfur cluster-binding protein [Clostridium sp. YIM B02506]|uniref:(2Fe-2S)-binding protein n=1 Tax=Clostridium sp. YIM B02506 TaxID=2910680 RepID=UPI001EEE8BBF|nr:2Fe-2S iron-sulfur cluster-binding protein [Clostridium sp. YIM B02506]
MLVILNINGKNHKLQVEPDDMLIDTLRANGYLGVKKGCDTSCCGLCTVWIDGSPLLSCTLLTLKACDKKIVTIEGAQEEAKKFGQILSNEGAEQCGFCSPGFIMTVIAMKNELKNPTEDEIIHYLTGNLCRCTGYMGQLRAVKKYLEVM